MAHSQSSAGELDSVLRHCDLFTASMKRVICHSVCSFLDKPRWRAWQWPLCWRISFTLSKQCCLSTENYYLLAIYRSLLHNCNLCLHLDIKYTFTCWCYSYSSFAVLHIFKMKMWNVAEYNTKTAPGNNFSSSNFLLARSSVPQCEQHSPTDPRELNANVDQMYQVTD